MHGMSLSFRKGTTSVPTTSVLNVVLALYYFYVRASKTTRQRLQQQDSETMCTRGSVLFHSYAFIV